MLDDIRNHDARPTEEELGWMHIDGVATAVRACVLGAMALAIGLGTSLVLEDRDIAAGNVAVFGPR